MKQIFKKYTFLLSIILILSSVGVVFSANPTYTLTITNDQQIDNKNYEFDIYILRTGSTTFPFSGSSQFYINYNSAIVNGGTLSFTILSGTCSLDASQQIANTDLSVNTGSNRLIIAATGSSSTHTTISNVSPGTRIGRFRITNTASFAAALPNLSWYNGSGSHTLVYAYISFSNVDITTSANHLVNTNNGPLPVVISKFNSTSVSNEVTLNWTTTQEINNYGFEVYRAMKDNNLWEKVGFVKGNGTTNSPQNYSFEDSKLQSAVYEYKLKQIDFNGNAEYFNLQNDVLIGKPIDVTLSQNYPNPSNPVTKIDYQLPFDGKVSLKVYDLAGKEAATLVDESKQAGYYSAIFDGSNLSSGVYFYRIIATGGGQQFSKTLKLVLVK